MRNSKFIDINVIFTVFLAVLLMTFTCLMPVSANVSDGVVSDDGIPNGDMSDGVISDTPDKDMVQNGNDHMDSSMNNGPADSGNSVIGEAGSAIGEAGKDVLHGAGNAANDIAGGMNDMANGTTGADAGGMGNLVGTIVWIVIAVAVIALIVYFVCRKTSDKK